MTHVKFNGVPPVDFLGRVTASLTPSTSVETVTVFRLLESRPSWPASDGKPITPIAIIPVQIILCLPGKEFFLWFVWKPFVTHLSIDNRQLRRTPPIRTTTQSSERRKTIVRFTRRDSTFRP